MENWTGTDQEAEEIIRKIYENEYEKLVGCAILYLKVDSKSYVHDRAEDVVQETFALAWERRKDVLSHEKPVGWLHKTLRYKVREQLKVENRWMKRLLQYEKFYVRTVDDYASLELKLELESLVPREDFDLLYRFYVEGYSYRELCKETGLTKEALGVRIHRIKRKIQEKLRE